MKMDLLPARFARLMKRGWWRFLVMRQKVVNTLLSGLYGQKMRVVPEGHVGLAAAVVLWIAQEGGRQLVMVRSPKGKDTRARLISVMGLNGQHDMVMALKSVMKSQLGEVFYKTLKLDKITLDRVGAAPMLSYTDEENGIVSPLQVLVWTMQVQPVQLELLKLKDGLELVLVPEGLLVNNKAHSVAPTHAALWRSVARHLPQKVIVRDEDLLGKQERADAVEDKPVRRVLH